MVTKQAFRLNQLSKNVEEFVRIPIFIPYLESIISSLKNRFFSTHKKACFLIQLHSKNMRNLGKYSFLAVAENIQIF